MTTLSDNEPGEEFFSHIHDGYVRGRIKQTLCGRRYREDMNSMGTHIYTSMADDVCSACREVFENNFQVRRVRRG